MPEHNTEGTALLPAADRFWLLADSASADNTMTPIEPVSDAPAKNDDERAAAWLATADLLDQLAALARAAVAELPGACRHCRATGKLFGRPCTYCRGTTRYTCPCPTPAAAR